MELKEKLKELIDQAKSGIPSEHELGDMLGVSGQSISNAKNNRGANANKVLSKRFLDELMTLAKYSVAQKFEFLES